MLSRSHRSPTTFIPLSHHRPHGVAPSMPAIMSLTALPDDMQIVIVAHIAATSEQPMVDLRSLWATYSSMRSMCSNRTVYRCLALDRFRCGRRGAVPVNFTDLLASQTQVRNPEGCFFTGIQTVFIKRRNPSSHASMSSPAPPMAGTIWRPI
jgi:hypothetical protein